MSFPTAAGSTARLSKLQGGDRMVLVLSRGGFCPRGRRQHEAPLQLHRETQVQVLAEQD
jgi:hypothetical protein